MPSIPRGKATVIGGAIRDFDPVRDQFTLKVHGGQSLKVLFDERTLLYRDGVRIPLHDLRSEDHASVETVLDGTHVFALSIRVLSLAPEGEIEGQVLSFASSTGELTLYDRLSHNPIRVRVPADTPVVRVGQPAAFPSVTSSLSDITKGALVSVTFRSSNAGRGIASRIRILATPGSAFVFTGEITALDLPARLLALFDPAKNESYKVTFDPSIFAVSTELHEGMHVTVTASFNGSSYIATALTVE